MFYMFKKLLFSLLALLMIYSGAMIAYRIFDPKLDTDEQRNFAYLEYDTLKDYILSYGESSKHILLFYSGADANSVYVKDTVLSTVQSDTSLAIPQIIEIADVTSIHRSDALTRLVKDWEIHAIPAFLSVGVKNGECVVLNRLEWDSDTPMSASVIEDWLAENGFRTGTYTDLSN